MVTATTANLYDVLGVGRHASILAIRRAWLASAKEHHPDRGGDPAAFREAEGAWRTLSDPVERAHYDKQLNQQPDQPDGVDEQAGGHVVDGDWSATKTTWGRTDPATYRAGRDDFEPPFTETPAGRTRRAANWMSGRSTWSVPLLILAGVQAFGVAVTVILGVLATGLLVVAWVLMWIIWLPFLALAALLSSLGDLEVPERGPNQVFAAQFADIVDMVGHTFSLFLAETWWISAVAIGAAIVGGPVRYSVRYLLARRRMARLGTVLAVASDMEGRRTSTGT